MKKNVKFWNAALVFVALMLVLPAALVSAAPPYAALGTATVDGLIGEWDLANDFFSKLYRSGNSTRDELGDFYLRYDCSNEVLYALVLSSFPVDKTAGESWIAISATQSPSDKVSFNEFAWVEDAGGTAYGWEASFNLAPQEEPPYNLFAHTNVDDGDGWQTAGTDWVELKIYCPPPPTSVTLATFEAASEGSRIRLAWETGIELDNLGFNVYRAEWEGGVRVKLNASLIASQAPGAASGASYEFVDSSAAAGISYFYWLEAIDTGNWATEYGPVSAKAILSFRSLTPTRPRLSPSAPAVLVGR